jgi:hypothetical protein
MEDALFRQQFHHNDVRRQELRHTISRDVPCIPLQYKHPPKQVCQETVNTSHPVKTEATNPRGMRVMDTHSRQMKEVKPH